MRELIIEGPPITKDLARLPRRMWGEKVPKGDRPQGSGGEESGSKPEEVWTYGAKSFAQKGEGEIAAPMTEKCEASGKNIGKERPEKNGARTRISMAG